MWASVERVVGFASCGVDKFAGHVDRRLRGVGYWRRKAGETHGKSVVQASKGEVREELLRVSSLRATFRRSESLNHGLQDVGGESRRSK